MVRAYILNHKGWVRKNVLHFIRNVESMDDDLRYKPADVNKHFLLYSIKKKRNRLTDRVKDVVYRKHNRKLSIIRKCTSVDAILKYFSLLNKSSEKTTRPGVNGLKTDLVKRKKLLHRKLFFV